MTRQECRVAAWALCLVGACGLSSHAVAADSQNDRVTALEQKLDRSLKLIEQLAARVRELEAERAGTANLTQPAPPAPPAPPPPAPTAEAAQQAAAARLERVEQQLTQLADANAARGGGGAGVPLHGFADVGIGNHTANEPGLQGANIGALDIFLNPQLGEHTRSLFELA